MIRYSNHSPGSSGISSPSSSPFISGCSSSESSRGLLFAQFLQPQTSVHGRLFVLQEHRWVEQPVTQRQLISSSNAVGAGSLVIQVTWSWPLSSGTTGLTEGIRASAQVEFCSQLGANVRCTKIVTMNFVKETLPNLIIRPLLGPYRYKHTSRQGFPLTRHEHAVLQHNDDER